MAASWSSLSELPNLNYILKSDQYEKKKHYALKCHISSKSPKHLYSRVIFSIPQLLQRAISQSNWKTSLKDVVAKN